MTSSSTIGVHGYDSYCQGKISNNNVTLATTGPNRSSDEKPLKKKWKGENESHVCVVT